MIEMMKRLNSVIQDINPVYVPVDSDLLIVRIKTKELVRVLFLFCVLEGTMRAKVCKAGKS